MVEDGESLGDAELLRYSRHILLNELGIEAQRRFQQSTVLIVGAGGLGCPAALYLAAAGVGEIIIADPDRVDLTNLQRQILYRNADVGASKAECAAAHLAELNPNVRVRPLSRRLEGAGLVEQVALVDLVLDCSDNFATRHALNRACVAHQKPLVSGAAIRFDGQISVFDRRQPEAPCYACLFPQDHDGEAENCATMGVFAPLAGIVGTVQAAEALKCLAGLPETLNGRLLLLDARSMQWQSIALAHDPDCPVCGSARTAAGHYESSNTT